MLLMDGVENWGASFHNLYAGYTRASRATGVVRRGRKSMSEGQGVPLESEKIYG